LQALYYKTHSGVKNLIDHVVVRRIKEISLASQHKSVFFRDSIVNLEIGKSSQPWSLSQIQLHFVHFTHELPLVHRVRFKVVVFFQSGLYTGLYQDRMTGEYHEDRNRFI